MGHVSVIVVVVLWLQIGEVGSVVLQGQGSYSHLILATHEHDTNTTQRVVL